MSDRKPRVRDMRPREWWWDSNAIWEAGLSPKALLVRFYLARCADQQGTCYPSFARIAAATGMSRVSVWRALSELEEHGWIVRKQRRKPGKRESAESLDTSLYTLCEGGSVTGKPGGSFSVKPGVVSQGNQGSFTGKLGVVSQGNSELDPLEPDPLNQEKEIRERSTAQPSPATPTPSTPVQPTDDPQSEPYTLCEGGG